MKMEDNMNSDEEIFCKYSEEIFSKSIEQPKPKKSKTYLAFVLAAVIVIAALSAAGINCVFSINNAKSINYANSHSHSLIYIEAVEPTCETTGNIAYWQCSECEKYFSDSKGKNQINEVNVILRHTFGDWQELKQATCAQEGELVRYCSVSDTHYEIKIIPRLSHQLTITQTGCIYTEMCQLCNNIIKYGGHTYENGKCVKCGKSEGFIAPLDEYTLGQLFSDNELVFNPTHNYWSTHEGVDFTASAGSIVKCIEDGIVKDITTDAYYGTKLTIEHSNGFTSVYQLICYSSLNIGDTVARGDTVGKVSDEALEEIADGPHLHLELYKDGVCVNPLDYILNVE